MPAAPCANHPKVVTYLRCGRCDTPICVDCAVDTPVGKKCRACAQSRTHVTESTPARVLRAFAAALVVAIPGGLLLGGMSMLILAAVYGYVVGEAALRAGGRSRSPAVQAVTALAALAGLCVGGSVRFSRGLPGGALLFEPGGVLEPYWLLLTGIGTAVALWHVRYL